MARSHTIERGAPVFRDEEYGDFTNPKNDKGLPLDFVEAGDSVGTSFTVPEHMAGWRGGEFVAAHPGAVATVLSTAMGHGSFHKVKAPTLARSMHIEYISFVPIGEQMVCEAKVVGSRGDEVVMEATIRNKTGDVLASAQGTFWLVPQEALNDENEAFSSRLACGAALARFQGGV